jgi:hypothetical protein
MMTSKGPKQKGHLVFIDLSITDFALENSSFEVMAGQSDPFPKRIQYTDRQIGTRSARLPACFEGLAARTTGAGFAC